MFFFVKTQSKETFYAFSYKVCGKDLLHGHFDKTPYMSFQIKL